MADVEQPTSGDAVERARKLLLHQLRVSGRPQLRLQVPLRA